MQMGSRQSSGGSQGGPRQALITDIGAARASKGHRRTASSGQGVATAGELGPEWTEEVDQVGYSPSVLTKTLCQLLSAFQKGVCEHAKLHVYSTHRQMVKSDMSNCLTGR